MGAHPFVIVDPADSWMTGAACIGHAPAYDETASFWEQRRAQSICLSRCPVVEDCRAWARRTGFSGVAAGERWINGRRRGQRSEPRPASKAS